MLLRLRIEADGSTVGLVQEDFFATFDGISQLIYGADVVTPLRLVDESIKGATPPDQYHTRWYKGSAVILFPKGEPGGIDGERIRGRTSFFAEQDAQSMGRLLASVDETGTPYPHSEGDVLVLAPECFVSADRSVISWKGENYYAMPLTEQDQDNGWLMDPTARVIAAVLSQRFYCDLFDDDGTRLMSMDDVALILRDRPACATVWCGDPTKMRGHIVLWDGRQPGGPGTPSVGVEPETGTPISGSIGDVSIAKVQADFANLREQGSTWQLPIDPDMTKQDLVKELRRWHAIAYRAASAIRQTREYVGYLTLPAMPGWSWFDSLNELHDALGMDAIPEAALPQYRDADPDVRGDDPVKTVGETTDGQPIRIALAQIEATNLEGTRRWGVNLSEAYQLIGERANVRLWITAPSGGVQLIYEPGSFGRIAEDMPDASPEECTHPEDAIMWNPGNEVIQCHKCGQVMDAIARKPESKRDAVTQAMDVLRSAELTGSETERLIGLVQSRQRLADPS